MRKRRGGQNRGAAARNPEARFNPAELRIATENRSMPETEKIYLRQAQIGPMANYVYLVGDPVTRKLAVVDPAWDVDAIRNFAENEGYEIDKILITHYHQDHLGGHMMGQNIEGAATM